MWAFVLACTITEPAILPSTPDVPLNPTILVVLPPSLRDAKPKAFEPHDATIIASSDAYDIVRLDVRVMDGHFDVAAGKRTMRYRIENVRNYAIVKEAIPFGKWQLRFKIEGNPIALRFVWSDGIEAITPVHHGWARLGEIDCLGDNVPRQRMREPKHVALFALFSDGDEYRIGSGRVGYGVVQGFIR